MVPDRARRVVLTVPAAVPTQCAPSPASDPPCPLQGQGPLPSVAGRRAVLSSVLGGYPVLPSLYTHPVYPPGTIPHPHTHPVPTHAGTMSTRADTGNTQFGTPVGEPRGYRTQC